MEKIKKVSQYLLYLDGEAHGDGISNLKMQKLVYYAQGFYSALFDKNLFDDDICAWTHGPVVEDLYHHYKEYGNKSIDLPTNFKVSSLNLDKKELEFIEEVFEVFGLYSAWGLRNMTHEESPWNNHEADGGVIPSTEITEYFKTRLN